MIPMFFRRAVSAVLCVSMLSTWFPGLKTMQQKQEVKRMVQSMTLQEKVGQLFVIRPEALDPSTNASKTSLTEKAKAALEEYPVGGVILFKQNIVDPDQLETFLGDLQTASEVPMLVAVDEEGGTVCRVASNAGFGVEKYPNVSVVAESGDPEDVRTMSSYIGTYLKRYGFNLDFAPVADVNSNPKNPVIGKRAFSSDPNVTAQMVTAAVEGFHEAGMLCTLKHFPGHGDTATDSHYGLATTSKTWEEMKEMEMLPFEAGIAAGTDVIMTAHITTPNVTGNDLPASLSYEILTEKLRGELGYDGVICTDALEMQAITKYYGNGEAAVMALSAGADILLIPADLEEAFDAVMEAVQNGTISEERLDESVTRILTLKQKAGLL